MSQLIALGQAVKFRDAQGRVAEISAADVLRMVREGAVGRSEELADAVFLGQPARTRIVLDGEMPQTQVRVGSVWHPLESLDRDHVLVGATWVPLDTRSLAEVRDFVAQFSERSLVEQSVAATLASSAAIDLPAPDALPFDGPEPEPMGLLASLRPYQVEAHQWMSRMARAGLGGILGDEMGLGKTITCIAVMCTRMALDPLARFLVVMPLSLVDNWRHEIHRFAPDVRVYVHHGPERALVPALLSNSEFDVMLTTYDVVTRDVPVLGQLRFDGTFCDEAQNVKNAATARWAALSQLDSRSTFLVTGTPLENRIDDVCSLASLAVPRVARDPRELRDRFKDDPSGLSSWVQPLLLRRRLADVGLELPPRLDQTLWLSPGPDERRAYSEVQTSLAARNASPLEVVGELRRAAAHPGLVNDGIPLDGRTVFEHSSRCAELLSRLAEVASSGERSIVFVSWQRLIDALADGIERVLGGWVGVIDGRTPADARQPMIDDFGASIGGGVLILNPRAAGVGLNIQAASRVHHLTLEWNPATEAQATARAHRSGQTRPVHVLRYVYPGTVDEMIEERLLEKRALAEEVIDANAGSAPTAADVTRLLTIHS